MNLPTGLSQRALGDGDLDATFEVYAAAELADCGKLSLEAEDIESDWARSSFDLATQSVGVFAGEVLIAAAEVFLGRRADAAVHPDHQGLGIGTALAQWTEEVARRDGDGLVGQTRFAGCAGDTLLRGRGYEPKWTSWVLELPPESPIATTALPPGHTIRAFTSGDERVAYELIENAFNEWPDRSPQSYDDWYPRMLGRRGFEPWQIQLAVDPEGTPVGVACTILDAQGEAYIDQLAVRRDQRGKGLARALMAEAFRTGRERGAQRFGLSTDSRTGALPLYQKVGMQVTDTWTHLAREV
ncbi:GNAT family N-acetyltransferase [Calidifontibacter terrae]